ncbi:MAG: hypothetical protein Q9217_006828 [Psora testacea]
MSHEKLFKYRIYFADSITMGSHSEKPETSNLAAWSPEPKADLVVGHAAMYEPGPKEMLVKNECIAFSPVDFKNQRFLLHPMPYPGILGSSFAGVVEKVGPDVSEFQPGDRVACNRASYAHDDLRFGAFQKYVLASVNESSKLDPRTSIQEGAAVIVNLSVSVAALSTYLGLSRPPLSGKGPSLGKKVLVYGGSSSCGGYAVKYATDAGYTVVTTSSPKNHDFVSSLGAAHVIDHTQTADKIVAELKANRPYDTIYDSIGLPPVTNILGEYLGEEGGNYCTLLPLLGPEKPLPSNVVRKFDSWSSALVDDTNRDLGEWYYKEYVPQGLVSGAIIPTRQIEVKGGLEKVQEAVNTMGPGGVSGHKLVLNPQL